MIDHASSPAGQRQRIRVLLADDHVIFRAALRALLRRQRDLLVVGEAGRGDDAVACAQATRPDVVLMDLAMPGEGGIEATGCPRRSNCWRRSRPGRAVSWRRPAPWRICCGRSGR